MMKSIGVILKYAAVAVICILALIPFYVLFYLSLNTPSRTLFDGVLLLPDFHFSNYIEAWRVSNIGTAIVNSLIITIGALAVMLGLASAAGYSIARFPHKVNMLIFNVLLVCMMVPAIIITVPLYTLMRSIGGINTLWAMILLLAANGLPLSVFLYTSFIKALPREVEESAIIDGCTYFSAFWRVTFHFLKPITASIVILSGLGIWNNYAQSVFFLQKEQVRTIPLAVSMFFQKYGADWNLMAAAAMIGLAPAVIAFLMFQKYFIKGITAGAVKG
ncbi:carbohydrate ABC transporter permease [Paenibacillus sp. MSJ-34]|uniref:carbohydrate ABC transporter permease n=2 Tax=unclassified Paenibacillus TaxID=185978 RepID=UPI001C0F9187|nr:carbohydrate ABC transporter permease [Paenibacillus sp. MSJ-34]MBU5442571.1 carbohydrate ABC transporter permease [Paenibacillus sp. MSJ-34]CAH0120655.1 Melibiose/raffinose/stachyose import permease protein MelC [Paenibacillus sp. CECT 9249]